MPRVYEFEGKEYEVDDSVPHEKVLEFFQGQVPAKDERSLPGRVADAAKASFYQTTQGLAGLAMLGGGDFADTIADYERNMPPVSQEMSRFQKAQGWGEAIKEVFNDWETLPTLIASGVTGSYPAIAGGVAGAAIANPLTAAAGVGLGSLATEGGNEFLQVFREEGVNLKDPAAIRKAFADEALVSKAKTKALQRGIPVAAFDAASAGLAGRLLGPAIKKGSGILRATAGEAGIQAGLGGAGEVAGSLVAGDPIEPSSVIAEVVSELGSGSAEVASVTARRLADQAKAVGLDQTAQVVEQGPITGITEALERQGSEAPVPPVEQPAAEPAQTISTVEEPAVTTASQGGEQTNEVQEEGQEVLTQPVEETVAETTEPVSDEPVDDSTLPEDIRPIETGERAESQGFFGGTYNVSSNDATEAWAKGEVAKFGDDLQEALRVSQRTQMTDRHRNLVQAEILTQAAKRYATDPTDMPAFELVQSLPSLLRQGGTEQGQALESRKRVNEKIDPYAAVITYVDRIRVGGVAKLPSRVRRIAQSFNKDDFERVAGLAAEEASKPTTIVDCG